MADVFDKTGYYGTADRPDSYVFGNGAFALGSFTADGTSSAVGLRICFSRVRPDALSGVIYVFYHDHTLYHLYYSSALVQYPFESFDEDHYAWDFDYDYDCPEQTSDYWTYFFRHAIIYGGDIDYDNAWDWDAITDPAIRAAVYDRYTPINLP